MKLKLSAVIESLPGLKVLSESQLPAVVSFKMSKLLKDAGENEELFVKSRNSLFQKYGSEVEKDQWKIKEECVSVFQKEMEQLLLTEVDVTDMHLNLDDLKDVKIEPKHLYALGWLIKE